MTSTVIPLKYRVSDEYKAERHLFLSKHADNDCGLTISNVPSLYKDDDIKELLCNFIEKDKLISCYTKRSVGSVQGYRIMVAFFESEMWLNKLLDSIESLDVISLDSIGIKLPLLGYKKYAREYNSKFKPVDELKKQVEEAVAKYDEDIANKRKKDEDTANNVDDDGWTTVTMASKHVFKAPKSIKKRILEKKSEDKLNPKTNDVFYAQNKKIQKNEEAKSVHKKFEESKKKIAELRAKRRFNPMS